jgi:putative ABC transport system substrate-binding protein
MRRRQFLCVLSAAAASWPTVAGAKHPLKIIGFLGAGGADAWTPMVGSFERLTQSRSQSLLLRGGSTEKHYG